MNTCKNQLRESEAGRIRPITSPCWQTVQTTIFWNKQVPFDIHESKKLNSSPLPKSIQLRIQIYFCTKKQDLGWKSTDCQDPAHNVAFWVPLSQQWLQLPFILQTLIITALRIKSSDQTPSLHRNHGWVHWDWNCAWEQMTRFSCRTFCFVLEMLWE